MIKIDMNRIREALPDRAFVFLKRTEKGTPYIEVRIQEKYLSDSDFEMCKDWQREIIGKENISEFYTEETGRHWKIYLKRQAIEFIGASDKEISSYIDSYNIHD